MSDDDEFKLFGEIRSR